MKFDFKGSAMLALPVTAAVWLVSYLFGVIGLGTTPLFASVTPTSVITGTAGTKAWGFISGILPFQFDLMTIFYVYLSAVIAIVLGSFLIGQFKLPVFRKFLGFNGNAGRIASVILWGAVPVYLVLVGFQIPSFMAIVGILVHVIAVSFVAVWLANLLKFKI